MPRIYIRPPRKEAPVNVNDSWKAVLEPAVQQILRSQSGATTEALSFKVLYDSTYRLVTQGHGRALHRKIAESVREHLLTLADRLKKVECGDTKSSAQNEKLLACVGQMWQEYLVSLRHLRDIFLYMDRNAKGVPSTDQVGKRLFREYIIQQVLDELIEQVVTLINEERIGKLVNQQTLKVMVDLLRQLCEDDSEDSPSLFDARFRHRLISSSIDIYQNRLKDISTEPPDSQLRTIDSWLSFEQSLGSNYLPEETRQELVQILEGKTFDNGLARIITLSQESVSLWVADENLEVLRLASSLELRGQSRNLAEQVSAVLGQNQARINRECKDAVSWVEETIRLREKFLRVAEAVGQDSWNSLLSQTHKRSIGEHPEASSLLAIYLDEHLKKSSSIQTEQVEPALDKALTIYSCLSDKDEFSLIFQRLLARRLLNNSSRSRQSELSWLQRLKEESLSSDSMNFERMIMNIDESRRMFHGSTSIAPGTIPTNVNVLSMHLWPKSMLPQAQYPLILPKEIAEAQKNFEEFYFSVKRDRVLKWNYSLSNADVKIRVGNKTYLASVPLACMSILNLFGEDEVYTTSQIADLTSIPIGGELERNLKSLYLAPGTELLTKTPHNKEVSPSDEFRFNTSFSSSKLRFKIKKVSASRSSASDNAKLTSKEDAEFLQQERIQKTEAAIVRIMKARKELSHAALVQVTTAMLQSFFKATPQNVKRAIQNLLARDYIGRKDDDVEVYRYIA